ncbi:glycosyltransferase family 39 protein, partial [Patescibacteria group bacterium]
MEKYKKYLIEGKWPYFWIILFGFLVYFRSLFFGYTYLDDHVLILENLFFLRDPNNIFRTFTQEVFHILHSSAAYYRPILTISFMFDSWISGESPLFYHFSNVVIHVISSSLVYLFFVKLKQSKVLALSLALIFSVHPVLSQAVSWIPGRNDSLLAVFFLSSMITFISYLDTRKVKYLRWHLVFFALSMFTKESAIFLPPIAIFYLLVVRKKKLFAPAYMEIYLGWGLIGICWFFLRSVALTNSPVEYGLSSSLTSVYYNSPAVLLYLGKVLFPINLTVLPTLIDSTLIYGGIALVVIAFLILFSKERRFAFIVLGLIWFFLLLLASFIRPSTEYVPDFIEHRLYLPIVGLFIILSEIDYVKNLKFKYGVYVIGALIVLLSIITINHTSVYKDKISFWLNAVKHSSSHPLAHKNLGAMYYLDGEIDNAEVFFSNSPSFSKTTPLFI